MKITNLNISNSEIKDIRKCEIPQNIINIIDSIYEEIQGRLGEELQTGIIKSKTA